MTHDELLLRYASECIMNEAYKKAYVVNVVKGVDEESYKLGVDVGIAKALDVIYDIIKTRIREEPENPFRKGI